MSNPYFQFKQFTVYHDRSGMKVTTDACLFAAYVADTIQNSQSTPDSYRVQNILDIGTGTGLLSLMVAQKIRDAVIDAIEIDAAAAQQAKENIAASPWKNRINVIHADSRSYPFQKLYNFIISNPPFYEDELNSPDIKKNIARHQAGMMMDDLLAIIKKVLSAAGRFCVMFPYKRDKEIEPALEKHQLHVEKKIYIRQSVQHDYFRIILAGCALPCNNFRTEEISIHDSNQQYTSEFTSLLKDYYLYL